MKNHTTGREYTGGNAERLEKVAELEKFTSDEWVTFLQAKRAQIKIKKGSRGVTIFCGYYDKAVRIGEKEETQKVAKYARVFNLNQTI